MDIDITLLNFYLGIFLLIAAYEPTPVKAVGVFQKSSKKIPPIIYLMIIGAFLIFSLWLLTSKASNLIFWYVTIAFSLMIVVHARWLSIGRSFPKQLLYFSIAVFLVFLRFLWPTQFINNISLILSLSWLGQFLVHLKILNQFRFMVASLIWMLYDIIFVWLTSLSSTVHATTQTLHVPLGIMAGENLLGTGDLLWASMLLALSQPEHKSLFIVILLVSNILLDLYANITQNSITFPLLILWVPLGFFIIFAMKKLKK